jgi:hypothetical protein
MIKLGTVTVYLFMAETHAYKNLLVPSLFGTHTVCCKILNFSLQLLLLRQNYTSDNQNELPAHFPQIENTTDPLQAGSYNTTESDSAAKPMDGAHDPTSSDSDILPVSSNLYSAVQVFHSAMNT